MDAKQAAQEMELLNAVQKAFSDHVSGRRHDQIARRALRKVLSTAQKAPYNFEVINNQAERTIKLYWKDSRQLGMNPDIEVMITKGSNGEAFWVDDDRLWKTMAGLNEFINESDTSGYETSPGGRVYYNTTK